MPHPIPTRTLAGITVPDTPLITRAITYAQTSISPANFNHVMRSWLFGHYIATHSSIPAVDSELHAITAILHDLGWASDPALSSADKRFEVDSANATRDFLVSHGGEKWDKHRLQLAWDAVALHTSASIAIYKQPEVKACSLGVYADFLGWQGSYEGALTKEVWDGICAAYPRSGFKEGVIEALCGLCARKPETTYDNFVADFGVAFKVEGYSLAGKRLVDVVQALDE